jgi:hypothetical protein
MRIQLIRQGIPLREPDGEARSWKNASASPMLRHACYMPDRREEKVQSGLSEPMRGRPRFNVPSVGTAGMLRRPETDAGPTSRDPYSGAGQLRLFSGPQRR